MSDHAISIFYDEPDGDYIADIPDLEFCSAHGETPEDALREVLIAKQGRLAVAEERGIPVPKPHYRPTKPASRAAG